MKWSKRSANTFFLASILVILLLLAAFFLYRFQSLIAPSGAGSAESGSVYSYHLAMVVEDQDDLFWSSVYDSASQAAQALDAYLEPVGDGLSEHYTILQQMRMAIAQQVDGILVYPDGSEEMSALIEEAVASGIPVVTMVEDDPGSGRQAHVGGNNYDQGQEYAALLHQLYEEEGESIQQVAVLLDSSLGSSQEILYSAILGACGDLSCSIQSVSVDSTNSFSAEESIRDLITGSDVPDVLICLSYTDTISTYQSVVDYNRVGVIHIIGNYDSATILDAIQKGIIHSTITMDAQQLGRQCIDSLMEYLNSGRTSGYSTVDLIVITQDTVSDYLEAREVTG